MLDAKTPRRPPDARAGTTRETKQAVRIPRRYPTRLRSRSDRVVGEHHGPRIEEQIELHAEPAQDRPVRFTRTGAYRDGLAAVDYR
jgi:hypothetical protein